jgi:hypothetical protein
VEFVMILLVLSSLAMGATFFLTRRRLVKAKLPLHTKR